MNFHTKNHIRANISDDELFRLRDALTDPDNEDWSSFVEEWPPTDCHGNVYPIWFTLDDLDENGNLKDGNGNPYNPFTGNLEPVTDEDQPRCNAPVSKWRQRYQNIRYCGQIVKPNSEGGYYEYCSTHRGRSNIGTAEEHLQTGLFSKSMDHLYEKLGPHKQLLAWGLYESLMGESTYDFAIEYRLKEFDFSDTENPPVNVDDDGTLRCKVGYPTEHVDPALSLFTAAMMRVQMMVVQPKIMSTKGKNEGMMERKTIETAQLTAPPSEHDATPQEFKTLRTWSEHHLNLPFSRLISDYPTLLEQGGVTTDPKADSDEVGSDDIVLEIDAEGENIGTADDTGTDPNAFSDDCTPQSQEIKENITNDD